MNVTQSRFVACSITAAPDEDAVCSLHVDRKLPTVRYSHRDLIKPVGTKHQTPNPQRDVMSIRRKLFDSYRDALKLQLKLKSVLGTLDEQSLVAVDSFLQSNAAGGARVE
ncbi:hypothetical protein [Burkholderia ubonensis]|uniref:hypothetical protein n=1 Tax=Burkholderia ubonensis TaxID=101571 RepID=UPI0039F4702D